MDFSLEGKTCIVTGANGGLGKPTAICLAKMGAQVVLVARDRKKGETALDEVLTSSGRKGSELMLCDLSNMGSIRDFVRDFVSTHSRLDVLVNTAAVFTKSRVVTGEGLELMFATNYLGPFLLTNLLLDSLHAGVPSRIITLSAPSTTKIDFADLQGEKHFSAFHAFGATKTADLLFAYKLADRLQGSRITSNVLFPGVMRTDLMRNAPLPARLITMLMGRDPQQAAESVCYLSSSKEVEGKTGVFFKRKEMVQSSDYSRNPYVQTKLWDVSSKLANLSQ
jgi:NAD(P)-dependent dehydrogenase (short-subunit alcohol dehydrogenase family)